MNQQPPTTKLYIINTRETESIGIPKTSATNALAKSPPVKLVMNMQIKIPKHDAVALQYKTRTITNVMTVIKPMNNKANWTFWQR